MGIRPGGVAAHGFRRRRKGNSPLYNGLLHIAVLYGAGIAAICYCVTRPPARSALGRLLTIPVFLAGNFVEWGMRRPRRTRNTLPIIIAMM
jgi:hypothetical protein